MNKKFAQATIWELMGLRWPGLIQAAFVSLSLTMILFLGPLSVQAVNGLWRLYTGQYLRRELSHRSTVR